MDDIDVEDISNFEKEMLVSCRNTTDIFKKILENKKLDEFLEDEIKEFLIMFKKDFVH